MADEGFKRELTAMLSADAVEYSRPMGDDEEATVRTLTSYREVLTTLIPEKACDGTETLSYSHRLKTVYAPFDYGKDLSAITHPLLVVAGTKDEAFIYCEYEPAISRYTTVRVKLLQGVTHLGVVV